MTRDPKYRRAAVSTGAQVNDRRRGRRGTGPPFLPRRRESCRRS